MTKIIVGCISLIMQLSPVAFGQTAKSASATAAQEPKLALQLTLSPDDITVTADSNFNLSVKWVNQSHKPIWCIPLVSFSSKLDESFTYDVRTNDGRPVPRAGKVGRDFNETPDCMVGPDGGSIESLLGCVMCAFEMRRPGVYTVQISRPDPEHSGQFLGISNKVTITVKAP